MDLPKTIVLGTKANGQPLEFPVEPPKSYAVRYDLAAAARTSIHRAAAAAAALASPRLMRELKVQFSGDALAFGGAVIDAFAKACDEHGIQAKPTALVTAGVPILNELVSSLVDQAEVDAVEGFSDPPSAG